MDDVISFGAVVLLCASALTAALLASKLTERASIPGAALFLLAAAVASDLFPGLELSVKTVERVGTVALIVILFDGGASMGLRRFRDAAVPIALLGVLGTFVTAGLVSLFALGARLRLDDRRADRRRDRGDRPGRDVLDPG